MPDKSYLEGIRTHQSRVKTVISPCLYLQATTAGFLFHILTIHDSQNNHNNHNNHDNLNNYINLETVLSQSCFLIITIFFLGVIERGKICMIAMQTARNLQMDAGSKYLFEI